MNHHAAIHIEAGQAVPEFHCEHRDGRVSVVLSDSLSPIDVYIAGTPEEIMAVGDRLWRVAVNAGLDAHADAFREVPKSRPKVDSGP